MLGLSATLTEAVFVYLCICICVFACQTLGNIVFEVLVPLPFQKYNTCLIGLSSNFTQTVFVYFCICVFVYLCIWYHHDPHER